jgi:hypothetical protein
MRLVAVEGIEPTSLDYRSSALAVELHRARNELGTLYFEFVSCLVDTIHRRSEKTKEQSTKYEVRLVWLTRRGSNPHLTA